MNKTTLLVLAAGLGSRYKGQKQIDGIGNHDEALMEFGLYDAIKQGFKKFVFIINDQFPEDFKNHLEEIMNKNRCEIYFVEQTLSKFIPEAYLEKIENRKKPLGTAHAIYCAKDIVKEPFVTINADDFYGSETYEVAAKCIAQGDIASDQYAMVAFELKNTLSKNGTVSRGVSDVENGKLKGVEEHTSIEKSGDSIIGYGSTDEKKTLDEEALVSMNFWILHPSFFDFAARDLEEFLKVNQDLSTKEFFLPGVIDKAIQNKELDVKVLSSSEKWFGLTYRQDKETVTDAIADRVKKGVYPENLWG